MNVYRYHVIYALISIATAPTIIFILSRIGGWRTLAEKYPCHDKCPSPRKFLGYGVFKKWIGYNGGIIISSNQYGLYLFPMPVILSFCHNPIFIPWTEIREIRMRKGLLAVYYEIHTLKAPEVDFALLDKTFNFVRENALKGGVILNCGL